jgi:branched-chain amino acid transport system permease protein
MRYVFKTSHDQDIDLLRHRSDWGWYAALIVILLALPGLIPSYYVGELAFVFVLAIASVGLMLLTGFTGLVSLGHGAFLLIGAYVEAHALRAGIPFPITLALAALAAGAVGITLGLPALRLTGLYLAIATLAFSAIVEHLFAHWKFLSESETFLTVPNPRIAGVRLGSGTGYYYVALAVLAGTIFLCLNLLRSPTGRAFIALRDSPIAAETLGVALARTKTMAFALSAAIGGLAGALYAHKISTLTAESFNVLLSLELLMMVVVGGMGSIKGAVLGAVFLGLLDPALARFKDYLPPSIAEQSGLQLALYGLILVFFVLFEPMGLAGRWAKIKAYFQGFPIYRRGMFKRTKSYMTSERMR